VITLRKSASAPVAHRLCGTKTFFRWTGSSIDCKSASEQTAWRPSHENSSGLSP